MEFIAKLIYLIISSIILVVTLGAALYYIVSAIIWFGFLIYFIFNGMN